MCFWRGQRKPHTIYFMSRALEYAGNAFRLELVLPGAVQVRQQALWHWLRRTESSRALLPGHSAAVDIVSVKEALQSAVAPALSAGLGQTLQEGTPLTSLTSRPEGQGLGYCTGLQHPMSRCRLQSSCLSVPDYNLDVTVALWLLCSGMCGWPCCA